MIVCLCRAVCEQKLGEAIDSGASSLDAVQSACGAGGDCGACLPMIAEWIERRATQGYADATL